MAPIVRPLVISLFALLTLDPIVLAHSPVDFLETLKVDPARPIEHAVEVKSRFDQSSVETMLRGPQMFSRSVGCMGRSAKKHRAYLNWFKIAEPNDEPRREVTVLDMVRGGQDKQLTIRSAEYLLCPSQLIASGVPDEIPDGLDYYKAYRIVDAPSLNREIKMVDSLGPETRRLGKPLFLCLAVEQWHHDEYVPASHPSDCFVVYELDPQDFSGKFSIMDSFGLNELQSTNSQWLCVRAALLRNQTK